MWDSHTSIKVTLQQLQTIYTHSSKYNYLSIEVVLAQVTLTVTGSVDFKTVTVIHAIHSNVSGKHCCCNYYHFFRSNFRLSNKLINIILNNDIIGCWFQYLCWLSKINIVKDWGDVFTKMSTLHVPTSRSHPTKQLLTRNPKSCLMNHELNAVYLNHWFISIHCN